MPWDSDLSLNQKTWELLEKNLVHAQSLRIEPHRLSCGATVVDFGVNVSGGIAAGKLLAEVCLGGLAQVSLESSPGASGKGDSVMVTVSSDSPLWACMGCQYAGWPVQSGSFFAMGSGPMRMVRGKEKVLEELGLKDSSVKAVGVLECDQLPDDSICETTAKELGIGCDGLTLCVAPTRSIAGCVQVVARSVETSLHKLFELDFDLGQIVSAFGSAPLCPPAKDFAEGIGRTNDAILYGGTVHLWVDSSDEIIKRVGPQVPSRSSRDWGKPFAQTFKEYGFDFYQVDPGLFSPAVVLVYNLATGNAFRFGELRQDVVDQSFGIR